MAFFTADICDDHSNQTDVLGPGYFNYGGAEKCQGEIITIKLKSKYKNLDDVIKMIGGNLVVGSGNTEDIVARYRKYGFDLVCHQIDLNTGLDMLQSTIEERFPS